LDLIKKIYKVEEGLKVWGPNVSGRIMVVKRKIKAHLGGIQRVIHDGRVNISSTNLRRSSTSSLRLFFTNKSFNGFKDLE